MEFNKFTGKKIIKASNEVELHNNILEGNKSGWQVGSSMRYISNDYRPYQILMKYVGF